MNINSELKKALKQGDVSKIELAFDELYSQYVRLIYVSISKYVSVKEDVEELTSDVFINFFNNLDKIDFDKNIKYYLLKSAKNLSINYLKKKEKEVSNLDYLKDSEYLKCEEKSNYSELINSWRKYLSDMEIEIILAHVLDGVELKEIAKKMGKSPNTIKSIYRRAVIKIRKREEK